MAAADSAGADPFRGVGVRSTSWRLSTAVIARVPSSPPPAGAGSCHASASEEALLPVELYRLTLYKWRYSLEAAGFDSATAHHLVFLKWLHTTRKVLP